MVNTKYGRLATATEQILFDILEEQKKTNELLSQLIPKPELKPEPEPKVESKPTTRKTRKKKDGDK